MKQLDYSIIYGLNRNFHGESAMKQLDYSIIYGLNRNFHDEFAMKQLDYSIILTLQIFKSFRLSFNFLFKSLRTF